MGRARRLEEQVREPRARRALKEVAVDVERPPQHVLAGRLHVQSLGEEARAVAHPVVPLGVRGHDVPRRSDAACQGP